MGQECKSDGSRKGDWSIETVRRCAQECSLAGVQMQVAGGKRSLLWTGPRIFLLFFLFFSYYYYLFAFVLTGVDGKRPQGNSQWEVRRR